MLTLKPFKDIVRMTKDGMDTMLAPVRERQVKAKVTLKLAQIDEELVRLEREIQEAWASKEPDLEAIYVKVNKYELAERQSRVFTKMMEDMFPTTVLGDIDRDYP